MNLKIFTFIAVFALTFFAISCCKAPEPAFGFSANTVENNTAIDPTKVINFSTTQSATWTVTGGGTITTNGVYTPPADKGAIVTITATSASGIKVTRTLYVIRSFKIINEVIKGGHVLSFYHGKSEGTDATSLPKSSQWWFSLSDNIAKQLTTDGRNQMEATGKAIQNMKIDVHEIYTSEFNRCVNSTNLMNLKNSIGGGNVDIIKSEPLTYFVYDEPNRYSKTMDLMKSLPIVEKKNYILVTHTSFSGNVPNPAPLADLNEGDAAVFKLQDNKGTPVFVGKITSQELVALQ